jgi:hypothetical protein
MLYVHYLTCYESSWRVCGLMLIIVRCMKHETDLTCYTGSKICCIHRMEVNRSSLVTKMTVFPGIGQEVGHHPPSAVARFRTQSRSLGVLVGR